MFRRLPQEFGIGVELADQVALGGFQLLVVFGRGDVDLVAGLAPDRAGTYVGVLHVGAGLPLEVDALLGVEGHAFLGTDLDDLKLEGGHADLADDVAAGLDVQLAGGVAFQAAVVGFLNNLIHQVVGVDHGPLAALHLAGGQVDHAVAEVVESLGVGLLQPLQDFEEDLEVVVLLVANGIDHAAGTEVVVAQPGRTQVLGDVEAGAVAAQDGLLIKFGVGEVDEHRAIFLAVEDALFQSGLYHVFAQQVGIGLVVQLVEADAQPPVGLVEALVHPAVHLLPEGDGFRVAGLPGQKHFLGGLAQLAVGVEVGILVGGPECVLLQLLGVAVLVHAPCLLRLLPGGVFLPELPLEEDVVAADEVVRLFSGSTWRSALPKALPGQHRFADGNTAVVDDLHPPDLVAGGLQQLAGGPAQQDVADVAQV